MSPAGALEDPGPARADGVVCFAGQDWWYHNRAHSDVQLMLGLARRVPVLLVNSIGMRIPRPGNATQPVRRIGRKLRSIARGMQQPVDTLPRFHVMSPVSVPWYGNARARALNAASIRAQVTRGCRRAGITNPVLFVTMPTAWEVVRPMPRASLLFNRSDRHSAFPGVDRDVIEGCEAALLRHSDRVLYVSHVLMEAERAQVGARAMFLDHGVDLEHFDPAPRTQEPADLAAIPHPRVGFFGGLDENVDLRLVERVARELPGAQVVLVGNATVPMQALSALPNLHWLGFKPYEDIPRYGAGFDVALMPWRCNEWIDACNPIKLKEYLALGLPVVSTDFPEVRRYAEHIRITSTADEFVACVAEVIGDPVPSEAIRRRAAVADQTWSRRVDDVAWAVGLAPLGEAR